MNVQVEWTIDLGDLGERDCLISAEVEEHRYVESRAVDYEVTIIKVTVPWLDGMNVSGLLSPKAIEAFSDQVRDTYLEAKESAHIATLEARAARFVDHYA